MKYRNVAIILAVIFAISALINIILLFRGVPAAELNGMQVIGISADDCDTCTDIQEIVDSVQASPELKVTSARVIGSNTAEAKDLIKKYDIKRVPVMILTGDLSTIPPEATVTRVGDAIIVDQLPPPYYDIENDRVGGIVDATILTAPKCTQCSNVTQIIDQLTAMGIAFGDVNELEYDSVEGKKVVKEFDIDAVPTIVFSEGAGDYPIIQQAWEQLGTIEDGNYVLREVLPPYVNISTNKVAGIVKTTFLADKSCDDCMEVATLKDIMTGSFGIGEDGTTVDVSSDAGKGLIVKYNITAVPTVLIQGDTGPYVALKGAWVDIGTEEKDGTLIWRDLGLIGSYLDLVTGKVVEAEAPEIAPQEIPIEVVEAPVEDAPEEVEDADLQAQLNDALVG